MKKCEKFKQINQSLFEAIFFFIELCQMKEIKRKINFLKKECLKIQGFSVRNESRNRKREKKTFFCDCCEEKLFS